MTPSAARGGTLPRPARGTRAPLLRTLVLGAIVCGLAGCLTFEGTLKPDGSGTFEVTYRMPAKSTPDAEKARHTSPHVTVDSVSKVTGKDGMVTIKGHFDDVTKISTAPAFKDATVTRTKEGEDERLVVKVVNPTPKTFKDEGKPGPAFTFRLPGTVKEANRDGKVSGDTVSWSFTLADWAQRDATDLSVRYALPAAAAKDGAAKDGDAKKAPATTNKKKN